MSAQTRKKPVQSEGTTPFEGFVPLRHEQVEPLLKLTKDRTELALVILLMSRANRHNMDGRADGWTEIQQSHELAERLEISPQMVNMAIKRLTGLGVLEQKSVLEGVKAKLLSRSEAAKVRYSGSLLRCCVCDWEALAKEQLAAEENEEDEEDKPTDGAAEDLRIADKPLVLLPGSKATPLPLTPAVRRRLGKCESLSVECTAPVPISYDITITGDTLRCVLGEPAKEKRSAGKPTFSGTDPGPVPLPSERANGKRSSGKSAFPTGDTDQVRAEELAVKFQRAGIADLYDDDLRLSVARTLRGVPAETLDRHVLEVAERRRQLRHRFQPGLALRMAESFAQRTELRLKHDVESGQARAAEDAQTNAVNPLEEYIRERDARKGSN